MLRSRSLKGDLFANFSSYTSFSQVLVDPAKKAVAFDYLFNFELSEHNYSYHKIIKQIKTKTLMQKLQHSSSIEILFMFHINIFGAIKFIRIYLINKSTSMKTRRTRKLAPKQQDYNPELQDEEEDKALKEQPETKRKKAQYHPNNSRQNRTQAKEADNVSQEDSQQSEILEIRHGDEETRDHVRPAFLRRWDGISNQLQLTAEEIREMSPMLRVYWEVKARNMNAIVFLQFGGMEFLAFENDAIKLNQLFKKKLKRFSKFLMVNFWNKEIEEVKKQLFAMKTPVLIMNQIEDHEYRIKNNLVRREVVEVITPALHPEQEDTTHRSRLLLSVFQKDLRCAVVVLDAESNHFFVEEFDDDAHFHEIRRIFNKYHPVELIVPQKAHKEVSQIARQICNPYINEFDIPPFSIQEQLKTFQQCNPSYLFTQLQQLYEQENYGRKKEQDFFSKGRIVYALTLVWRYLSSLSLLEKMFHQGIFHSLGEQAAHSVPFYDSQVYENLQIFRVKSSQEETYAQAGTLMGYLDHCHTNHGKKLLHRWIDQPLTSQEQIKRRQEAVHEILQNEEVLSLHGQLLKYDKLEKRLGDIYHWVSRHYERGKNILTKYINFEKQYDIRKNPAVVKLKEIIEILKRIQQYQQFLKKVSTITIHSPLLKQYIDLKDIQNVHNLGIQQINKIEGIPEIAYVADIILRRINYDELTGHLEPMPGESQLFDEEKKEMERINACLEEELKKWKDFFQTEKITYVSVRAKNQIQIPKMALKKSLHHKDLIFSSEVANYIRYTTPDTNNLSEEIMMHQKAIAESYEPFFHDIVEHFCRYKFLWNLYIKSMSNMDVLMSLAEAAKKMPVRCLPSFSNAGMAIQKGYHVNLLSVKEDIVANSVHLKEEEKVLLLTGPNMGGKSTFLKQTCSFAILAQIGSYIPAEKYSSIIYDQIFCRMGASDRIYEGKSTFYVELEETKRIISKATSRSLVVIDELGRGTSTFDGMAIAEAILDYLIQKIGCVTLYSTHYTQITDKFQRCENVKMMKMGYEISEAKFCFTYQLVDGVAEKSFANNVGRMVRLPEEILRKAELRSQKMHQEIRRKKQLRELCHFGTSDSLKSSQASTRTSMCSF